MRNTLLFPQQTKLNQFLFAFHNWHPKSKHDVVLSCGGNALMAMVFKIQVISLQTTSEMGDHMILSALITCSIVK